MDNKYTVDRIEENYVILEAHNGDIVQVLKLNVKGDVKEGDILVKNSDVFIIDKEETLKRKEAINNMMKNMWK